MSMAEAALAAGLYKDQKGRCAGCGRGLAQRRMHIDHRIPKSRGGPDGRRNRQLMCDVCNQAKGDQDEIDFYRSRGWLL